MMLASRYIFVLDFGYYSDCMNWKTVGIEVLVFGVLFLSRQVVPTHRYETHVSSPSFMDHLGRHATVRENPVRTAVKSSSGSISLFNSVVPVNH